jgi:hypothetical protein
MRSYLVKFFAPALLLAIHVPAAFACINDRESLKSEKEFKSSYIEQPMPAPQYQPQPTTENPLVTYGGPAAGIALLLGGCALGVIKTRSV